VSTGFFNSAESAVTYAATAAEILLLVRLTWLGLLREFKIFSIFVGFDAALTVVLSGWDYHSPSYEWFWALSAPIWTLLLAAVTLELLHRLREPFPTETGNRTAALFGFLIGLTVSAVASMLAHPQAISRSAILFTIISRRCILSGCILGILAQGAYLALGYAPLMANWRLHRRILLTYMTGRVIASYAATSNYLQFAEWIRLANTASFLGCFCVWAISLRPAFSSLSTFSRTSIDEQLADMIVFNRRSKVDLHPVLLPNAER